MPKVPVLPSCPSVRHLLPHMLELVAVELCLLSTVTAKDGQSKLHTVRNCAIKVQRRKTSMSLERCGIPTLAIHASL